MNSAATNSSVGCIKAANAILGDKWTPQLLRFFINEEVVRFCQIQDLVGGINPRTLSARLDHLEEQGIITKLQNSVNSRCEYTLTPKGQDLVPILHAMEQWSTKHA
jgi:DNA-binding HxlR family transcriptional regulator